MRDHNGSIIGPPLLGNYCYETDHYSGSQVLVYIGDVVIDTTVAIHWQVQQDRTPVYGYASNYYSFVSGGKVMIQGNLTLAFKESGYLLWPIKRFVEQRNAGIPTTSKYRTGPNGEKIFGSDADTFAGQAKDAYRQDNLRANVEQMFAWADGKDGGEQQEAIKKLSDIHRQLAYLEDDEFEDWAEAFEDAIWFGSDVSNPMMRDQLFSKNFLSSDSIRREDIYSHRRPDQYPPVDLIIAYGDTNTPAANHTVKKLMDVSFCGQSQVIECSGEPILEVYSFIARNQS
jgi:hypothetical protein